MNVDISPCNSCTALCCKGEQIKLMPEKGDVIEDYTRVFGISPLDGSSGWFIPQTTKGKCAYLRADDKCGIYEHRPFLCRNYTCWDDYLSTPEDVRIERVRAGRANPVVYERGRHVLITQGRIRA